MPFDLSRDLVIRWDGPQPAHVSLLRRLGVAAVLLPAPDRAFSEVCASAGIATLAPPELQFVRLSELGGANAAANFVLTDGLWPGVTRPPSVAGRGDETASASREPWVDANGYLAGYLRALRPGKPPVLGYLPDKLGDRAVPYDSLELALIEAWTAGGNYLLAVEPHYRAALLRKEAKATAAWEQLGRTGQWLRQHVALFRQPCLRTITVLVEPGAATAEIANLMYRRNASPLLAPASDPPPPHPAGVLALIAANLKAPSAASARRILAHAEAGSTVVVAAPPSQPWWKTPALKQLRSEPDREFFALGKGRVVAYRRPIADPSEFALDVIDILTHKRRPVRLWNAPSVIALATASPVPRELLLHLVNYGSPIDNDVQARVQGHFTKARLLRPEASPLPLQTARRGTTTEVFVPELRRLGVVAFSE
ncbi:MAG: hypothetical protein HYS04_01640 [Acidobacteria bacterium]|nr:hypothetical protein [Acidobacteriota bacterium]